MLNLHDSLSPELFPQFRELPHRFYSIVAAGAQVLRAAERGEPLLLVMPEPTSASLPAGAIYEARVGFHPESYILGFSGTSQQAAGFEVRIQDRRDDALFWTRAIRHANLTGGSSGPPYNSVFYLPKPRLILEPGLLNVRLRNLDLVNANTVQFVIHVVQPCQP